MPRFGARWRQGERAAELSIFVDDGGGESFPMIGARRLASPGTLASLVDPAILTGANRQGTISSPTANPPSANVLHPL